MNTNKKGTVIVVDDDPLVRTGVERLLKSAGYYSESYSSAKEFLALDHKYEEPACLLLDVKMPELSGLDLQEELVAANFALPIVFISGHGDISSSVKAMKKGAVDFLTKPFDEQKLFDAISDAFKKDSKSRAVFTARKKIQKRLIQLTPREKEILTLVITGMSNKSIANYLNISEKTVKVHRGRVMTKMNASSVAQLVRMSEKIGIKPVDI